MMRVEFKRIGVFFAMLCFLSACNSDNHPAPIENNQAVYYGQNEKIRFIKVKKGQTINEIAKEQGVPIKEIKRVNSLKSYDNIGAGQIIKVPIGRYRFVKENETLESIARIYDIDLDVIAKANGLLPVSVVYAGEYIKIPDTNKSFVENQKYRHIDFDFSEIEEKDQQTIADVTANDEYDKKQALGMVLGKDNDSAAPEYVASSKFFKNKTPINSSNFIWPLQGKVIKKYEGDDGISNEGINIAAKHGEKVKAAANGEVLYVGDKANYGKLIILRHNNGYMTAYAHLDKILVKKGQMVNQGTHIATVGNSGDVDISQLQFSIKKGTHTINPDG
jgi:murein DD-endopeptidase MepM/ murein hydrolase activator NlpD